MTLLTYQMAHEDVTALRDAEAEQIHEHAHVMTVGARCQRLVADLVDEEGNHHLRQTVADVLAHGGDADLEQVPQLLPGHRTEIAEREPRDMHLEVDGSQQHHRHPTTHGSGDGSTLHTQLRTTPATEDQRVVAHDVQYVHDACHHHRIHHLVGTPQRGGEGQRQCLEERQRTRQSQIYQSVAHQFGTQAH